MIAYLQGKLAEAQMDTVLLVTQGVGYELQCSLTTVETLQNDLGKNIELWAYTHVREDALQLFGFLDKTEKQMFLSLLKVNGVGPKMAITILSGASPGQILEMIENEDVKALSKLPKVGKKTAEQMILTLKGKLVVAATEATAPKASPAIGTQRELKSALLNLGFRSQDIDRVVVGIDKNADLESGLKTALSALTSL
jgi:Holliday junction DNA helicase RuvA